MKLPTDFDIKSLAQLREMVKQIDEREFDGFDTIGRTLEMTEAQYLRYKELVFKEDPMRFFLGMRITLSTPDATATGGSSVQ